MLLVALRPIGCTQNLVMPTMASSKPKSTSNSVCEGTNETILLGVLFSVKLCPLGSVKRFIFYLFFEFFFDCYFVIISSYLCNIVGFDFISAEFVGNSFKN